MDAAAGDGEDLASIQAKYRAVEAALRDNGAYLGMKGANLQEYFLQLGNKELLLLKKAVETDGGGALGLGGADKVGSGSSARGTNGHGGASSGRQTFQKVDPREAPAGPVRAFDGSKLEAVVAHLCDYEAVVLESTRALRALSSLAYQDAAQVGNDERVVPQIVRLMCIHSGEAGVHLAAMRAICNMAYDQAVALNKLTEPKVLDAVLASMAKMPSPKELSPNGGKPPAEVTQRKDIADKAGEAAARIVAAEEALPAGSPPPARHGALGGLFLAASGGEATWQAIVPRLVANLVANEVVTASLVAKCFAVGDGLKEAPAVTAAGWLQLSKQLAVCEPPELPQALIDAGTIRLAQELMDRHPEDNYVQLTAIEAMSGLVGNRMSGLMSFAEGGGMRRIEAAMRTHGGDVLLQTKGIRALASGTLWPESVQEKSGYNTVSSVNLTKVALAKHEGNAELVSTALEAIGKYLDKVQCHAQVKEDDGEALVKATMAKHVDVGKLQNFGRIVLQALASA